MDGNFTLGEVTISRVVEIGRSSFPTTEMLIGATREAIGKHLGWLKPHFWDAGTNDLASRIQTWVVRTPRHTILIDTGIGNDKQRAENPAWHKRHGTFLEDLAGVGVRPEHVDFVVTTHLHVDHVGWNTRLDGDRWVPTFPNARYVMHGEEWDYWRFEYESGREAYGVIADSVVPIVEAGQAMLVDGVHAIDEYLTFEPTPGHTPGHVCVRLRTSGGEAVFSGDVMHRTVQVAEPQWSSRFCADPGAAAETRRQFIERHADSGVLVLPAHFPAPGFIVRERGGFRFQPAPDSA